MRTRTTTLALLLWGALAACKPSPGRTEAPPRAAPSAAEPIPYEDRRVAFSHILIRHRDTRVPTEASGRTGNERWRTRSREEAHPLADSARARASRGEPFHVLVEALSEDERSRPGHGLFLVLAPDTSPEELAEVGQGLPAARLLALTDGELSPVLETPLGFHVIKREPKVRTREILVRFEGVLGIPRDSPQWRPKAEARARAEALRRRIVTGEDFATLARQHSEDEGSAPRGGERSPWVRGTVLEPIDRAVAVLRPGEVSEVVESELGFHLLQRLDAGG